MSSTKWMVLALLALAALGALAYLHPPLRYDRDFYYADGNQPVHITCYSNDKVIYDGDAKGGIQWESRQNAFYFAPVNGPSVVGVVGGPCILKR